MRSAPHGQRPVFAFHLCAGYFGQGENVRALPPFNPLRRTAACFASERDLPPTRPIARAAFWTAVIPMRSE